MAALDMTGQRSGTTGPSLNRRQFLIGSAAGIGALALTRCAPSVRRAGATVRLPDGALGFPSPFAANADLGYNQMSLLYDTLLWKDGSGQLLPWLAESHESSPDHLRHTFTLREGLRWSDNRPLTADDVVFTFDYYAKQGTLSPPVIIQPPQGIAKVSATGARTVEVVLDAPYVTFLEQVAAALPIVPKHIWSSIDDPAGAQDRKILVGSGAYRLASYNGDGGALLYTARSDYFLGAPFVSRIEENPADDPIGPLLAGATDVARGVGLRADTLAPFQNQAFGVLAEQGSSTAALYWNMGKEGPLSDVRFRRAWAMAIDRADLVARLAAGRGRPGNPGFLGPENPFLTPVPQYPFDVAGANALLDGAGYRRRAGEDIRRAGAGNPLSVELLIENTRAPLAEILVAALRQIGVELRPKQVELGPQLFGNKFVGAYDVAALPFPGPGPGGPNADPDVLRLLFSSRVPPSLQAATNYVNTKFDDLADRQRLAFDQTERMNLVAQMQRMLADDLPILALYYPETELLYRRQVLDQWYITPGQFPSAYDNKQLFITGQKTGSAIRPRR
jgi:peptide/nickel transport system substrate-binding protein